MPVYWQSQLHTTYTDQIMNFLAYVKTMFLSKQRDMLWKKRKSCILKKGVLTVLEYFVSNFTIYSIIIYEKMSKNLVLKKFKNI